jgi:hypothetical protein
MATPVAGPQVMLANAGLNEVMAEEGIFLYPPPDSAAPGISQAEAEHLVSTDPGNGGIVVPVRSAQLVTFHYAKLGRPPVLAWVVDASPATPMPNPCCGPPGSSSSPTTYAVAVVDAQTGDSRLGQIIWTSTG